MRNSAPNDRVLLIGTQAQLEAAQTPSAAVVISAKGQPDRWMNAPLRR